MDNISTKNELIAVNTTGDNPVVSARDLHSALGLTERFSKWFQKQLQFGFEEGNDYVYCPTRNEKARQTLDDYSINIDMAKQICMTLRNEKGTAYRQYFLEIEKKWNSPEQVMARAMQIADKRIAEMQLLIEANAEKWLLQKP